MKLICLTLFFGLFLQSMPVQALVNPAAKNSHYIELAEVATQLAEKQDGLVNYIRVTAKEHFRKFEYCEENLMTKDIYCERLGMKDWFSVQELKKIARAENIDAYIKTFIILPATSFAIVGLSYYIGGALVFIGAASIGIKTITWATAGSIGISLGLAGSVANMIWNTNMNPWRQFREAKIIGRVMDQELDYSDFKETEKNAEILHQVLSEVGRVF